MKNKFEKGDFVSTALGNGHITKVVKSGERDEHILFHPDAAAQKKYDLKDKSYTMGYSEIIKHLDEGHSRSRNKITGERKRSRNGKHITSDRAQIERDIRASNKRKKSQQKQKEMQAAVNARNAAKKLQKNSIDESTMTLIDFLKEEASASNDLLPTLMKDMKKLQKELSDYKKVGDQEKINEITAKIQDLNNVIIRKKQGK